MQVDLAGCLQEYTKAKHAKFIIMVLTIYNDLVSILEESCKYLVLTFLGGYLIEKSAQFKAREI